jgi:hypothetical protein
MKDALSSLRPLRLYAAFSLKPMRPYTRAALQNSLGR